MAVWWLSRQMDLCCATWKKISHSTPVPSGCIVTPNRLLPPQPPKATGPICVGVLSEICYARYSLLLHCPLMWSWKPRSELGSSEMWWEMTQCNHISCWTECAEWTPSQSCCGWSVAVILGSSSLWVCSTCWPNPGKEDASPVAPCGQTEQTRPLWHSCVPWGRKLFMLQLFHRKHCHFNSLPLGNWDLFCSVLLYCESEDTAHFNLCELRAKTSKIHTHLKFLLIYINK